jgi:hypothetical protein
MLGSRILSCVVFGVLGSASCERAEWGTNMNADGHTHPDFPSSNACQELRPCLYVAHRLKRSQDCSFGPEGMHRHVSSKMLLATAAADMCNDVSMFSQLQLQPGQRLALPPSSTSLTTIAVEVALVAVYGSS